MKFIRLDLLTLLISLFILNSCKNQDTVGLGVIASNQINGNLIDTSTIVVNTIPEDSVITSGLAQTPLSYFKDPVFGTTEANLAIDLNLPNGSPYTVPYGTITVDSALLVLRYAAHSFYGDSIVSRYKANVYQLGERVLGGTAYYNTKKWNHSTTLLGSKTFFSRTNDSVRILYPVVGGVDTIIKLAPQLRVPLSPAFINSILFNAPKTQLSSNLVFKNNVNGLYVTLDKTQSGPGGTIMFALDSAASIQIFYKNANGSSIDTAILNLPSNLHAAEIKHTYTTAVQTELNNTSTNRKTIYLQSLGGLRSKISFPYIKNILKTVGSDVVINRAELIVSILPGSNIPFAPLPKLALYRYDLAGQRTYIQDASNDVRSFGSTAAGGFYNSTDKQYHFLITAYIQDLLHGGVDYGTFIAPSNNTSSTSIVPTAQVDGRTIAGGFDKTSAYSIKLNIFYTKITK